MQNTNILKHFKDVICNGGNQHTAKCPAHDDGKASLSINLDPSGKTLVKCQAGCDTEDVMSAAGLEMSDLMPPSTSTRKWGAVVCKYDYRDEQGKLLYQVCRTEDKQFPVCKADGTWGLGDIQRVLYRLPELVNSDPAQPVYIVEGEKDADNLTKLGFVATTNQGGASKGKSNKWRPEFSKYFSGRNVVILPDNDDPGRAHANYIALSIRGVAASVKMLELPGLSPKGDVSDWLADGGTGPSLAALAASTAEWTPSAGTQAPSEAPQAPTAVVGSGDLDAQHYTDVANGRRFAEEQKDNVRFAPPWDCWVAWDGTRWFKDEHGSVVGRYAQETGDGIWDEVKEKLHPGMPREKQKELMDWGNHAHSASGQSSMVKMARCNKKLEVQNPELVFDQHPWFLNCPNGTLDLRTGELRPHCREDFITGMCPVAYDPDAHCGTWLKFLHRVMDCDPELIEFLQRLSGYFLTGDVTEQILAIFHGSGGNGKSTYIGAMDELLGRDYYHKAGDGLMIKTKQQQHPQVKAALVGKRLCAAIEVEKGIELNEVLVKELTGGDMVSARWMYGNDFNFKPTHKLLLGCNDLPKVTGTDDAVWRRVKCIPWKIRISEQEKDKDLPAKLKEELPGILAWAVRGCWKWRLLGLQEPQSVLNYTTKYRATSCDLAKFIGDECVVGVAEKVKSGELYVQYQAWCSSTCTAAETLPVFSDMLEKRGHVVKRNNGSWRLGLRLKTGLEKAAETQNMQEDQEGGGPKKGLRQPQFWDFLGDIGEDAALQSATDRSDGFDINSQ